MCVETARDLEPPLAVTVSGTVKQRGNHYRKDDRPEVTSPSSYILGGNAAAKRAGAREAEAARLEARPATAGDAEARPRHQVQQATTATPQPSWPATPPGTTWTTGRPPARPAAWERIAQLKAAT